MKRLIVGLDLSLTATGVACADGTTEVLHTTTDGQLRLVSIRDSVLCHCKNERQEAVDLVVLEGYAYGAKNQAHQMGELGGVVRVALWEHKIPFVVVPPKSVKKYATGKGNASKNLMLTDAVRRLGYPGADDNEADALWLRTMGLDRYGLIDSPVPALNRTALAEVAWPNALEAS